MIVAQTREDASLLVVETSSNSAPAAPWCEIVRFRHRPATITGVEPAPTRHLPESELSMVRFTIRDLVLLTLVVALAVGWWIDRSHLSEQNNALRNEQKALRFEALRAKELSGEIILPPPTLRASR